MNVAMRFSGGIWLYERERQVARGMTHDQKNRLLLAMISAITIARIGRMPPMSASTVFV